VYRQEEANYAFVSMKMLQLPGATNGADYTDHHVIMSIQCTHMVAALNTARYIVGTAQELL
jgi:hypothetical protein